MGHDPNWAGRIRVGHREREAATALLQEAAADGRLGLDELEERLEAALQAKTYADLNPLLSDLAAQPLGPIASPPSLPATQGPQPAGYSREDPLRLDGGMSSETRVGEWTVPPFIRINQGVGSVKLDFLRAEPAAPVIEIEVIGGAGSIRMILPDGWGVDVDRLTKSWGSISVKVPRRAAAGLPLLVCYGSVGMGSLKARPPSRRELHRAGLGSS